MYLRTVLIAFALLFMLVESAIPAPTSAVTAASPVVVWGWGNNEYGQVGDGTATTADRKTPCA